MVARCGATHLRAGAFKPRTSPYSFAGHGTLALQWLRDAADEHGLGVVTEVMDARHAERVAEVAEVVQIGARNMQNYTLLHEVGRTRATVLLKRAPSATLARRGRSTRAAGCDGTRRGWRALERPTSGRAPQRSCFLISSSLPL